MKYFLDTEFHEYKKKSLFGKSIDTIELISIGIVKEDVTPSGYNKNIIPNMMTEDEEYYAICKDFDLKAAWNSWQLSSKVTDSNESHKVYWLRENVLKSIWVELSLKKDPKYSVADINYLWDTITNKERYYRMKLLLALYGKTREQIAEEIKAFTLQSFVGLKIDNEVIEDPEFYAYYADYDWVVFCWLFGRMVDLPKGFPMYCNDLQQTLSDKYNGWDHRAKQDPNYPKQTNEHNALSDAKFNKKLHYFLQNL